jgi:hypothetical protein
MATPELVWRAHRRAATLSNALATYHEEAEDPDAYELTGSQKDMLRGLLADLHETIDQLLNGPAQPAPRGQVLPDR